MVLDCLHYLSSRMWCWYMWVVLFAFWECHPSPERLALFSSLSTSTGHFRGAITLMLYVALTTFEYWTCFTCRCLICSTRWLIILLNWFKSTSSGTLGLVWAHKDFWMAFLLLECSSEGRSLWIRLGFTVIDCLLSAIFFCKYFSTRLVRKGVGKHGRFYKALNLQPHGRREIIHAKNSQTKINGGPS